WHHVLHHALHAFHIHHLHAVMRHLGEGNTSDGYNGRGSEKLLERIHGLSPWLFQLLMKRAWMACPSARVAETTTRAPAPSGPASGPTSLLGACVSRGTVVVLPASWTMARAFVVPSDGMAFPSSPAK